MTKACLAPYSGDDSLLLGMCASELMVPQSITGRT